MELITVREIYRNKEEYIGKQIQVGGWIRSIRDSKAFGFIVLSDGSFFEPLQIVYHDTMENFAAGFQAERGTQRSSSPVRWWQRPRPSSLLRSRQTRWRSKACPHRIIRCRRSATALST